MIIPPKISRLPVVWELRKLTLYSIYSIKFAFKFKSIVLIGTAFKYFPVWWRHQQKKNEPLKNDRPWIVFAAKDYLDKIIKKNDVVYEYGSGASSLYFSRRVAEIYSVENDPSWYHHLSLIINDLKITNICCRLVDADVAGSTDKDKYISRFPFTKGKYFESYAKSIDNHPDGFFDIVLIDGRARAACVSHAASKVKQGGYLILDNSERTYYFNNNDFILNDKEWKATHFTGPTPYSFQFSRTSFFQKL